MKKVRQELVDLLGIGQNYMRISRYWQLRLGLLPWDLNSEKDRPQVVFRYSALEISWKSPTKSVLVNLATARYPQNHLLRRQDSFIAPSLAQTAMLVTTLVATAAIAVNQPQHPPAAQWIYQGGVSAD